MNDLAQAYEAIEDVLYFYDSGDLTHMEAMTKLKAMGLYEYECKVILEEG